MKRASLSALPARTQPEPADLTDRLLAREAGRTPESSPPPTATPRPAEPKPPTQRRKRAPKAKATTAPEANAEPTLEQALAQAAAAAEALRQAAQRAPARYELSVRYRLQALAHHVQQVTEFLSGRIPPP